MIQKILANLSDFEFDNKEEIRLCGRFYSINIRTGNYAFESAEGDDFKSIGFWMKQGDKWLIILHLIKRIRSL